MKSFGAWNAGVVALVGFVLGAALTASIGAMTYCVEDKVSDAGGFCSAAIHFAAVRTFLYNWQSLIGSMIALGAAIVAVRPVYGQLQEDRRQTAISRREALALLIGELEAELALIGPAPRICESIQEQLHEYDNENLMIIYAEWPAKAWENFVKLQNLDAELLAVERRNPLKDDLTECRLQCMAACQNSATSLSILAQYMRHSTSGPADDEIEIGNEQADMAKSELSKGVKDLLLFLERHRSNLESAIKMKWRAARELEARIHN